MQWGDGDDDGSGCGVSDVGNGSGIDAQFYLDCDSIAMLGELGFDSCGSDRTRRQKIESKKNRSEWYKEAEQILNLKMRKSTLKVRFNVAQNGQFCDQIDAQKMIFAVIKVEFKNLKENQNRDDLKGVQCNFIFILILMAL